MNAAFEVAIAGEHGSGDKILVVNGLSDIVAQRPTIADTGAAAVGGDPKAELFKGGEKTGIGEVGSDNA